MTDRDAPPGARPTLDEGIAVAISTMDRPDALRRCLASLSQGALRPSEIVIVDQSRGAETRCLVAEQRAAGLPIRYEHMAPLGLGASQNRAVQLASRAVVAVTDDDCVVDARWLACVAETFATAPTLGAMAGRVLPLPAEGARTWPVSTRTSTERMDFRATGAPWRVGSGNNFAVRRALFLHIGGCDERLGPGSPGKGGVDMDLFYRLLRAGAHVRYEPDAIVFHERQTLADRLARRPLYGHGMGACVALRLRERDVGAAALLGGWVWLRLRMMAAAARRRDPGAVREEVTMLGSTLQGLRYGLRAPPVPRVDGASTTAG